MIGGQTSIFERRITVTNEERIQQLAIAIYTVNRHAKTATNNRELYTLKNKAIQQLLRNGDAQKIGLHFIENPQLSKQSSTVLVACSDFLFHTLPTKEDFTSLPHLGNQDQQFRNPQIHMNLKVAKELLLAFIGEDSVVHQTPPKKRPAIKEHKTRRMSHTQPFRSSYLDGK